MVIKVISNFFFIIITNSVKHFFKAKSLHTSLVDILGFGIGGPEGMNFL